MRKTILKLSLAAVFLLTLLACNFPGVFKPTPRSVSTAVAQTPGVPITGAGTAPATPSIVQVRVSVATNCRTGPGVAYPEVSGFFVGQVAQVVGRSSNRAYWIIRDPNQHGELCWLWRRFATVTGNVHDLPTFGTPPTPTPTTFPSTPVGPISTP